MENKNLVEDVQILKRLKVIKGHVNAVEHMIGEKRSYEEIVIQLEAIRSAIVKTTTIAAQCYAKTCICDALEKGNQNKETLNKPIELLMKVSQHSQYSEAL
jgi:CsoR family transcriptional regulator, copper-sensing transcriptional repressor